MINWIGYVSSPNLLYVILIVRIFLLVIFISLNKNNYLGIYCKKYNSLHINNNCEYINVQLLVNIWF